MQIQRQRQRQRRENFRVSRENLNFRKFLFTIQSFIWFLFFFSTVFWLMWFFSSLNFSWQIFQLLWDWHVIQRHSFVQIHEDFGMKFYRVSIELIIGAWKNEYESIILIRAITEGQEKGLSLGFGALSKKWRLLVSLHIFGFVPFSWSFWALFSRFCALFLYFLCPIFSILRSLSISFCALFSRFFAIFLHFWRPFAVGTLSGYFIWLALKPALIKDSREMIFPKIADIVTFFGSFSLFKVCSFHVCTRKKFKTVSQQILAYIYLKDRFLTLGLEWTFFKWFLKTCLVFPRYVQSWHL